MNTNMKLTNVKLWKSFLLLGYLTGCGPGQQGIEQAENHPDEVKPEPPPPITSSFATGHITDNSTPIMPVIPVPQNSNSQSTGETNQNSPESNAPNGGSHPEEPPENSFSDEEERTKNVSSDDQSKKKFFSFSFIIRGEIKKAKEIKKIREENGISPLPKQHLKEDYIFLFIGIELTVEDIELELEEEKIVKTVEDIKRKLAQQEYGFNEIIERKTEYYYLYLLRSNGSSSALEEPHELYIVLGSQEKPSTKYTKHKETQSTQEDLFRLTFKDTTNLHFQDDNHEVFDTFVNPTIMPNKQQTGAKNNSIFKTMKNKIKRSKTVLLHFFNIFPRIQQAISKENLQ